MTLYPSDRAVLANLMNWSGPGLTTHQLSAMTGYSPRTVRQAVYRLRQAGYRIGADRVFRVRKNKDSA